MTQPQLSILHSYRLYMTYSPNNIFMTDTIVSYFFSLVHSIESLGPFFHLISIVVASFPKEMDSCSHLVCIILYSLGLSYMLINDISE